MELGRRALFNLLRMNWENNRDLDVEAWQVENYRTHTMQELFLRLASFDLHLNRDSFLAYAENFETPEDLTDAFLEESDLPPEDQDQIYLLIFELWRRLVPEKIALSIFCDELDHQIQMYDHERGSDEELQDALANLLVLLDQNSDQGDKPEKLFETVNKACAQDLETFLYDYIAEQIDSENFSYAQELLDGFSKYIKKNKWLDLLFARVKNHTEPEEGAASIEKLTTKATKEKDLDFNLELLNLLVYEEDPKLFTRMAKKSLPLLRTEEDLSEFLLLSADYFHYIDRDENEQKIQALLEKRKDLPRTQELKATDQALKEIKLLIK